MSDNPIRVKKISSSARFIEPRYLTALVILDKDGIEVPVSIVLSQEESAPDAYTQIEQFFTHAAEAMREFKDRRGQRLSGDGKD